MADKWACPCCGGETVEMGHGLWRNCVAGCLYGGHDPWGTGWWASFGELIYETGKHSCRDLGVPTCPLVRAAKGEAPPLVCPWCAAPVMFVGQSCETTGHVTGGGPPLAACPEHGAASATCGYPHSPGVAATVAPPCPRCSGPAPPDATSEPRCAACGAQTRYLRPMPPPPLDPHAAMRANLDGREEYVLAMARSRGDTRTARDVEFCYATALGPCIHRRDNPIAARACPCERAERT